jgi:hypothetical protein
MAKAAELEERNRRLFMFNDEVGGSAMLQALRCSEPVER